MKFKILKMIKLKRYFLIRSFLEEIYVEIDSLERKHRQQKIVSDTLAYAIGSVLGEKELRWLSKDSVEQLDKAMTLYDRTS